MGRFSQQTAALYKDLNVKKETKNIANAYYDTKSIKW